MSTLYITGNGFDRHHGLKTCYSDFHRFIDLHHTDLEWDFEEHFRMNVDENYLWYQFEEDLAIFDLGGINGLCVLTFIYSNI